MIRLTVTVVAKYLTNICVVSTMLDFLELETHRKTRKNYPFVKIGGCNVLCVLRKETRE